MRRRGGADNLSRGIGQVAIALDHPIDQADPARAVGAHAAAGQHQAHGAAHPEQAYAAHRAAEAWMDAKLHLGQA